MRPQVFLALLVPLAAAPVALAVPTPADFAALAAFADAELVKAYAADDPGAAVLVRWRGKTVLRKGYGMANLDLEVPVAPEQVFEIGSVTKQFTAAAILRLAEQGKLELSDPIQKYLPDFPTGDAVITIDQLLHHTSGVPSYTGMPEWLPRWREDMSLETLIGLFRGKPLDFPPGTSWSYSNSGYVLLGAVIEKVAGRSYEEYVEKELFAPLGMVDSRYGHQEEVVRGRAAGYQKGAAGWENAPYLSLTQPYAAGSLMSTVDDLARWSDALEGGKVVSLASRDRMFTPAILRGGDQDGVSTRYGLGNGVTEVAGRLAHEHGGGIHGYVCALLRVPGEELLVVILSNNPASEPGRLADAIAEKALGGTTPPEITVPEAGLDDYTGVYLVPDSPKERWFVKRQGARLALQRTGGSLHPMQAIGTDLFRFAERPAKVRFVRDAPGKIVHLEVDEGFGPVFRSRKTAEPIPAERTEIAVEPAALPGLVGVYALAPGFDIAVTMEAGKLFAQATGQERFELHAESADRWFLKEVDALFVFTRGAAGTATSLVLDQGGQQMPAPKKP
jgi:CubicO group peptidase (beta-lactamase class C family)